MRDRDRMGYREGKRQDKKHTVVTFTGWSLNKGPVLKHISLAPTFRPNEVVTIHYDMFGQQNRHNVLPLSNRKLAKKHTTRLQVDVNTTQLDIQKMISFDVKGEQVTLDKVLEVGKHYVVHQTNIDLMGTGETKSSGKGHWIWDEVMEVTEEQAHNVYEYKSMQDDIDAPIDRNLLQLVAVFGRWDGYNLFKLGTSLWGDNPSNTEWIQTRKLYVESKVKDYRKILLERFMKF